MNLARTSNTLARVSNTLATHAAQLVESVGHAVSAGAELAGELAASAPAMVANTAGLGAAASVGPGGAHVHEHCSCGRNVTNESLIEHS